MKAPRPNPVVCAYCEATHAVTLRGNVYTHTNYATQKRCQGSGRLAEFMELAPLTSKGTAA